MRRVLHFCGLSLPPNNPCPLSSQEKNIRYIPVEAQSAKCLTLLLKTVKVIKSKSSQSSRLNVMWCPGWDLGTEEGHQAKE